MILDGTFPCCSDSSSKHVLHDDIFSIFVLMNYRAFNTSFVSKDKWFEVDGAQAARDFIRRTSSDEWDGHRLQLVWDAIALHTNPDIARYKQPEVIYTSAGTFSEVVGPELAKRQFVRKSFSSFALLLPAGTMAFSDVNTGRCHHGQSDGMGNYSGGFPQDAVQRVLCRDAGPSVSHQATDYV